MYLAALFGCLLVGGLVVAICLSYLQRERIDSLESYYVDKADSIADQMGATISEMNAIAIQLRSSPALQRMFVNAGSAQYQGLNYFDFNLEDRKEAQGIIWMFVAARSNIAGINIFNESSYVGMRETPSTARIQTLSAQSIWDFEDGATKKLLGLHEDLWDVLQKRDVISVVRAFEAADYSFVQVGKIEVQIKYSLIEGICQDGLMPTSSVAMIDGTGNVIYPAGGLSREYVNQLIWLPDETVPTVQKINLDGDESIAVKKQISDTDWTVYLVDRATVLKKSVWDIIPVTFLAVIPIFLLILSSVAIAVRQVVKPIMLLTREVEQISPESLKVKFKRTRLRELNTLQNAVTSLLSCADEATRKLLLAQQTELTLRIIALQAQINPHYLFNSLSVISAVGMEEESERVPLMCYELGELYRYVSQEDTAETTLADEISHIVRYLGFMKYRYENNLQSEILLDGDLSRIPIARLSLQPMVENCFTHAFKGVVAPYRVRIDCRCSERGWHFMIADNGNGFSEEKIKEISHDILAADDILKARRGYEKLKSRNMAIMNLYIRLKTQYGEHLWFEILKDEQLGGALVKVEVEYERKESTNEASGGDN